MPRLNHGTLLENLVVLEVSRALATQNDDSFEFASAFSMPPLTQCWHEDAEDHRNNPKFNMKVMTRLMNGEILEGYATSYAALLKRCLLNQPNIQIVPYQDATVLRYPFGGPNGALLVAMLRRQFDHDSRMWINDLSIHQNARYFGVFSGDSPTVYHLTCNNANLLLSHHNVVSNLAAFCNNPFPYSIPNMIDWKQPCSLRIGFLDPDSYSGNNHPSPNQVGIQTHVQWLTALANDSESTASIMFFSDNRAPIRPTLKQQFHDDAVNLYPISVVFCHGNHMVGVKFRQLGVNIRQTIIEAVRESWETWSHNAGCPIDGMSWETY